LILEKTSRIPLSPDVILSTAFMRQRFLAGDPQRIAGLALVHTDYSLLLPQVRVPTWLIWGAEDDIAPLRIADALDWILPHSQQIVLDGVSHVPMKEVRADFSATLLKALQTEPNTGPASLDLVARKGCCDEEQGTLFSGHYDELTIRFCTDVVLESVTVANLKVSDSDVVIRRSRLTGKGSLPALQSVRSEITITAADISGETGILTEQSRLDLAAVRFIDTVDAVKAQGNPSSLLSSTSTRSDKGQLRSLHMNRSMLSGESL
jgi:hypothetical protein